MSQLDGINFFDYLSDVLNRTAARTNFGLSELTGGDTEPSIMSQKSHGDFYFTMAFSIS